jgi:uncharacterized membrane protein
MPERRLRVKPPGLFNNGEQGGPGSMRRGIIYPFPLSTSRNQGLPRGGQAMNGSPPRALLRMGRLSQDKQTVNILILELATMIVAISLAFTSTLITTFDIDTILSFIFTNTVVIWFWWEYVVDRLLFPPKTSTFPILDIFVLILISLIPFALREGHIYYISAVIGLIMFFWALMFRDIIKENLENLTPNIRKELRAEMRQRLVVGLLFIVAALIDRYYPLIGIELFVILVLFTIGWNFIIRRGRRGSEKNNLTAPNPQDVPVSQPSS